MGNSNSRKCPPVIAECKAPMYCINKLGGRHLLLGGGGGAARTGIVNQIESFLLSFQGPKNPTVCALSAELTNTIDTGTFSTMNMDVVCCNLERGVYLIAAGHDQYCDIYETNGYEAAGASNNTLSHKFRHVGRLTTDLGAEGSYQKCARFDKSTAGKRLVTGGSDGHIRVWGVVSLIDDRNPEIERKPILEINAHNGVVEDIDISPDGRYLISVGEDAKMILWDMNVGKRMQEIPYPSEINSGYRVRSVRFTSLGNGGSSFVFVVAYNAIVKNRKSLSFLALWAFHRERHTCTPIVIKQCSKGEAVSCLSVSGCGNFTGIGTLGGSVSIFDTHEMKPLLVKNETHGIFVTAVEFLDRSAEDVCLPTNDKKRILPGAAADSRASLVSLSADQSVQLHCLPFEKSEAPAQFLLKLSVISVILYLFVWLLSGL